jgi:AAA+ ATPase superfamily predicted ATPase
MIRNIVGPPVRDNDLFGRDEFIDLLWDKLNTTNVLLAAPRRFGKTSVMYHLLDQPKSGYRVLHLDLEKISEPVNFVLELWDKMNQDRKLSRFIKTGFEKTGGFFQKHIKTIQFGAFDIGLKIELKDKMKENWQDYANRVFIELKDCPEKILFIFDELALMLDNFHENGISLSDQKAFLYWFRSFRQNPALGLKHCRFLLGSSISIEQTLASMKISASINDFERVVLPELTPQQALEFINALFKSEKVDVPESQKQRMLKLIGPAIPYFIQVFVSEVCKSVKIRHLKPTPSAINRTFEEDVLGVNCKHYFIHYHERLIHYDESQKIANLFLKHLCLDDIISRSQLFSMYVKETGKNNQDDFNRLLSDLENDFYIKYRPDCDGYHFATAVLKEWWKRYYAL